MNYHEGICTKGHHVAQTESNHRAMSCQVGTCSTRVKHTCNASSKEFVTCPHFMSMLIWMSLCYKVWRCVGNQNENLKLLLCQVPKRTREKDRHNTWPHKKLTVRSLLLRFRANSQTLLTDKAPFLNGKTMHVREREKRRKLEVSLFRMKVYSRPHM